MSPRPLCANDLEPGGVYETAPGCCYDVIWIDREQDRVGVRRFAGIEEVYGLRLFASHIVKEICIEKRRGKR